MFLLVSLSSVTTININQDRSSCSHSVPLPIRGNFVRFWTFMLIYIVFRIYANIHSSDWCWCWHKSHTRESTPTSLGRPFLSLRLTTIALQEDIFQGGFYFSDKREAILAKWWERAGAPTVSCRLRASGFNLPLLLVNKHCLSSWSTNKQATTSK